MKPKHGFSKEIYAIVKSHGPLAYNGIHSRLRERSVRMSKDQVRKPSVIWCSGISSCAQSATRRSL